MAILINLRLHYNCRLSGLLTARFILHLRRLANSSVRLGDQGSSEVSAPGDSHATVSSFRAMGNTISSSLNDFGDDPVARVKNANFTSDVELASTTLSGSHLANAIEEV